MACRVEARRAKTKANHDSRLPRPGYAAVGSGSLRDLALGPLIARAEDRWLAESKPEGRRPKRIMIRGCRGPATLRLAAAVFAIWHSAHSLPELRIDGLPSRSPKGE